MGGSNKLALLSSFARAAAITAFAFKYSRYIPRSIRAILVFLVALNIRTFPLVWHVRLLYPWMAALVKDHLVLKTQGTHKRLRRLTAISPLDRHPLDVVETWKSRAGIADCDYNGHLSNSSYAKNADFCRLNAATRFFGGFVAYGGHVALAGTYHLFLKEIPLNAEYEIFLYHAGWEEHKWAYLVAAFATKTKKHHHKHGRGHGEGKDGKSPKAVESGEKELSDKAEAAAKELLKGVPGSSVTDASAPEDSVVLVPPVTEADTTSAKPSADATPYSITSPAPEPYGTAATPNGNASGSPFDLDTVKIPEGYTLNAVAVSQYCFKHGRVTVPPRVAFIASGFGPRYRWDALHAIRARPDGPKRIKDIMRGGWKDPLAHPENNLEADFWEWKECEPRGRKAGDQIRALRDVMGALGGGAAA